MKRRYLIAAIGCSACVALVMGVLAMLPPHSGVTKANFDRIEKGMSRADVEAVLGSPPMFGHRSGPMSRYRTMYQWQSDDGAFAVVHFVHSRDEMGVTDKVWTDSTETMYQKICRWQRLD